jgi:pimeloyl-ACP methyl ester carboxylesterase
MFTGTSVRLVQYPNAGHMPMLEQPEATVRDAIAFLEARE